jgi:hypothetical protein
MTVRASSVIMSATAVIAAAAIAIPPSVAPPTQAAQSVQLTAQTSRLPVQSALFPAIFFPRQGAVTQPVGAAPTIAAAAVPAAPTPTLQTGPILSGLGAGLSALYYSLLPWIDYAVNLAQYAVGFIPWVGILAPQIGIVYYNFVRPVANSLVDNLSGFLQGNVGLIPGLGNILTVTWNSLIGLGIAEVNWLLGFLPPLPPFPFAAAAAPQQITALTQPAQTLNADVAVTKVSLKTDVRTDDPPTAALRTESTSSPRIKDVVTKPTQTPAADPKTTIDVRGPDELKAQGDVRQDTQTTDAAKTDNDGAKSNVKPHEKVKKPAERAKAPRHDNKSDKKPAGK